MSRTRSFSRSPHHTPSVKKSLFKQQYVQLSKTLLIIFILLLEGVGQSMSGSFQLADPPLALDSKASSSVASQFDALKSLYENLEEKKNEISTINNSLQIQSSEDLEDDIEDKRIETDLEILEATTKWRTSVSLLARLTFEHKDDHDDYDTSEHSEKNISNCDDEHKDHGDH